MGFAATNANSSEIKLGRKIIKQLGKRSDHPGLIWLAQWVAKFVSTCYLLHLLWGTCSLSTEDD